jgi:hypothetical protein
VRRDADAPFGNATWRARAGLLARVRHQIGAPMQRDVAAGPLLQLRDVASDVPVENHGASAVGMAREKTTLVMPSKMLASSMSRLVIGVQPSLTGMDEA